MSTLVAAVLSLTVGLASADNILFLQSTASKSHHIWHMQIIERLYENGHNLTILSFEEERSVPGKTFLVMSDLKDKVFAEYEHEKMEFDAELPPIINILFMYDYYEKTSRHLAGGDALKKLLAYPRSFKFDLIIYEFTMGQFLLGFVDFFGNPPLISVSAFNIPPHTEIVTDTPIRPSYLPYYASDFGSNMNFVERAKNTFYWTADYVFRNYIYMTNEERRAKQLFGSEIPPIKQIEKRSDIILVNADFSMDYYQLLAPNVIPVGGLHVSRPEDVPPFVQQFIARASKGVILFSLGTNVQSEMFGPEINRQILNAFRSMPDYGIIWKHGVPEMLGEIPGNVLILTWVPQSAVLANSRTKLFVSHGGLLGTQEATWYGVPVVGIPFMVDQYANIDKMVKAGVATKLIPKNLNGKNLKDAILRVIEDPSYHENMKKRSKRFQNQPDHPLDRAVFWFEKVLENKGLPYLQSPAHDMNFIQVYNLDLIGVVVLAAIGVCLLLGQVVNLLIPKRSKPKSKKE